MIQWYIKYFSLVLKDYKKLKSASHLPHYYCHTLSIHLLIDRICLFQFSKWLCYILTLKNIYDNWSNSLFLFQCNTPTSSTSLSGVLPPTSMSHVLPPVCLPGMTLQTFPPRHRRRRARTMFDDDALTHLEAVFVSDQYPDIGLREQLAEQIGVSEARVQVWVH